MLVSTRFVVRLSGQQTRRPAMRWSSGIRDRPSAPLFIAPILSENIFQKVFSDKINLRSLLNSSIRRRNQTEIAVIHNIEISQITTTASLHECEPTMMYDCWCTFNDKSTGSYKLIRTHDYESIARDVRDSAKLDYWKQWKEHKAFHLPVRILVLNFSLSGSSLDGLLPVDVDIRHACPGLNYIPPPPEVSVQKVLDGSRQLEECENDFQRWCHLISHSIFFVFSDIPALYRKQPFLRAVRMIDMEQFTVAERAELMTLSMEAMMRLVESDCDKYAYMNDSVVQRVVVVLELPED